MKVSFVKVKTVVGAALGSLMFVSLGAGAAGPIGATLQTLANEQSAVDDNSNMDPVKISVLITKNNGLPAPTLGEDLTSEGLPAGWVLATGFNRPDLGCGFTISNFESVAVGIYTFEVAPNCPWVAGEYHYFVSINRTGQGVGRFRGSTLGNFTIPEVPPPPA